MTLVRAAALGIDRFALEAQQHQRSGASEQDCQATLQAVYRQVLDQQHLMRSERLEGVESLFRHGDLSVRELVRAVARSGLYRQQIGRAHV